METMDKAVIERTLAALRANRMQAYFADDRAAALALVKELCPAGSTVSSGGSVTLDETGILGYLKGGEVEYIDRFSGADPNEIIAKTAVCDVFLMSSNAITETGELYNIDGYGNRLSALICGPKSVIVVAGYNKIVRDLGDAQRRLKSVAAPKNAVRLGKKTPCAVTGYCRECTSPERICCHTVISSYQRQADRIKVIIVGEPLGF